MKNSTINKIKQLLGMEVNFAEMLMADGVTKISADAFEAGNEVFVVTEDEQMIPVPIGEYELEDGMILVVVEEGMISEIKEKVVEEEAPMEEETSKEMPEEEMSTPISNPKKTVESIVKETFFAEIENLKKENEELKAKLELLSKVDAVEETKTELTEMPTPISFNPENENKVENFKLSPNKPKSTMDKVLEKMYK
jgi:hypothetical protein